MGDAIPHPFSATTTPLTSPPMGPPSFLGPPLLPRLDISPEGTPEHVEVSLSPADSTSSYFDLPERTSVAAEPPSSGPSSKRSAVPPLERAPSWEDLEIDEDDEDFFADDDGSGQGYTPSRRRSSGAEGRERVSILEELELAGEANRSSEDRAALEETTAEQHSLPPPVPGIGAPPGESGDMQIDAPTQEASDASFDFGESSADGAFGPDDNRQADDDGMLAIDEESLSALERIFICAKSEAVEDR